MTGSDVLKASPAAEPFASLGELQHEHVALMRAVQSPNQQPRQAETIRAFLARARATGARLDGVSERDVAQSILDYWTAVLIALPGRTGPLPDLITLAEYDPSQADDLAGRPSPFKGLNAFAEADADWFFGREDAVKLLLDVVARERLVMVAGPSGSGKSSLVLAGLVPRLKRGALPGSDHWHYLPTVTTGSDPLVSLLQAAHPSSGDAQAWNAEHKPKLLRSPSHFNEIVRAAHPNTSVVLVVDQFEELFTLGSDQQTRVNFVESLWSIIRGGAQDRIVITVREDFLDHAKQLPGLGDPKILFRPPPMTTRELRRVIEEPAKAVGLKIQEDIVNDLVNEIVGDPTALPLLQFALKQLWDHRNRNRITWAVYQNVGRPSEALKRTAEELFDNLKTFENQEAARRIFLALVQPGIGAEFLRRRLRRETLTAIEAPDRINRVLARFVDAGLIIRTPGIDHDDDRFEVSHETLIRNWPRLTEWLRHRKVQSERVLQLQAVARRWQVSGRKPDYLLKGEALKEAAQFRDAASEVEELVAASENAAQRQLQQTAQRNGIAAIVFLSLLVIAIILGISYRRQRESAEANFQLALRGTEALIQQVYIALESSKITATVAKTMLDMAESTLARLREKEQTPETTKAVAKLLVTLSNVADGLGNSEQSLKDAQSALTYAQQLLPAYATDPELQQILYQANFRIGDALYDQKQFDDALRAYDRAKAAVQKGMAIDSGNHDWQQDLAFVHNRIGDLLRMKEDTDGALKEFDTALQILSELVSMDPANLDWQRDLASTQVRVGQLLSDRGDLDGAMQRYRQALAIRASLVTKDGDNEVFQSNLAYSHRVIGDLLRERGQLDEALNEYQQAVEIQKQLAARDPSNLISQDLLASALNSVADIYKQQGELQGAIDLYAKVLKIRSELAARAPANRGWQQRAAASEKALADAKNEMH